MTIQDILRNAMAPKGVIALRTRKVVKPTVKPVPAPLPTAVVTRLNDEIILRRGGIFSVNDGYDNTSSALFLAANAPETQHLITVTVPQGSDQSLLITHFANELSDIAAWGFFTWNMYIDDVPVQSYFGIQDQLGQTNLMRKVGVDILVNAGQTLLVDVVSTVAVPANYSAVVSLIGAYGTYDYNRD